jgi:hypothetical protein
MIWARVRALISPRGRLNFSSYYGNRRVWRSRSLGFRLELIRDSESGDYGPDRFFSVRNSNFGRKDEGATFLMEATCRLVDLLELHPRLLWDTIILATYAVLFDRFQDRPYQLSLDAQNVPGFGSREMILSIDAAGIDRNRVASLRRTYETTRQVELASIAIAGLALHHAGNHEIRDIAIRGSAADYLVGEERYLLEVAGRSRRTDFAAAWGQKWDRLSEQVGSGFFVCVVEFETPAGRL